MIVTDKYTYVFGSLNVDYLHAPYALLTAAFGNDGTVDGRDEWKQMFQWIVPTDHGNVEIYDYKIGDCYHGTDGLSRAEMTDGRIIEWHVQGPDSAIREALGLLDAAEAADE